MRAKPTECCCKLLLRLLWRIVRFRRSADLERIPPQRRLRADSGHSTSSPPRRLQRRPQHEIGHARRQAAAKTGPPSAAGGQAVGGTALWDVEDQASRWSPRAGPRRGWPGNTLRQVFDLVRARRCESITDRICPGVASRFGAVFGAENREQTLGGCTQEAAFARHSHNLQIRS
jgi:hypothetical protein